MYLGQGDAISSALSVLASKATPVLVEQAKTLGQTLAAEVQPVIQKELKAQIPTFAIITGAVLGFFLVVGISAGLIVTKERRK